MNTTQIQMSLFKKQLCLCKFVNYLPIAKPKEVNYLNCNYSKIYWTLFLQVLRSNKGQLLEIHLLEKTARHQNLDCSTPFEQMNKYMKLLESTFPNGLTRFEQMSIILLSARNVEQ